MIARHYHKPSGQWSGPHSRSYSSLIRPTSYSTLKEASDEKNDVKIKHHIPESLIHYFLSPEYPRTERDIFEKNTPQIIGISYLTDNYTISTVTRSSMWNQRRSHLAYWRDINDQHYLQIRFLYDFSSASMFSQQYENKILTVINFCTNGGDKHPTLDPFAGWEI